MDTKQTVLTSYDDTNCFSYFDDYQQDTRTIEVTTIYKMSLSYVINLTKSVNQSCFR